MQQQFTLKAMASANNSSSSMIMASSTLSSSNLEKSDKTFAASSVIVSDTEILSKTTTASKQNFQKAVGNVMKQQAIIKGMSGQSENNVSRQRRYGE